jgi:hypothetical protein
MAAEVRKPGPKTMASAALWTAKLEGHQAPAQRAVVSSAAMEVGMGAPARFILTSAPAVAEQAPPQVRFTPGADCGDLVVTE